MTMVGYDMRYWENNSHDGLRTIIHSGGGSSSSSKGKLVSKYM